MAPPLRYGPSLFVRYKFAGILTECPRCWTQSLMWFLHFGWELCCFPELCDLWVSDYLSIKQQQSLLCFVVSVYGGGEVLFCTDLFSLVVCPTNCFMNPELNLYLFSSLTPLYHAWVPSSAPSFPKSLLRHKAILNTVLTLNCPVL